MPLIAKMVALSLPLLQRNKSLVLLALEMSPPASHFLTSYSLYRMTNSIITASREQLCSNDHLMCVQHHYVINLTLFRYYYHYACVILFRRERRISLMITLCNLCRDLFSACLLLFHNDQFSSFKL